MLKRFFLELDVFNLDFNFMSSIKDIDNNYFYEKIKENFKNLIIEVKAKKLYNKNNYMAFLNKEIDSLSLKKIDSSFFNKYPILKSFFNFEFNNYFEFFLNFESKFYLNIEKESLEYESFLDSQCSEYSLSDFHYDGKKQIFTQQKKRLSECKIMRVCSSSHFHDFPVYSFFYIKRGQSNKKK